MKIFGSLKSNGDNVIVLPNTTNTLYIDNCLVNAIKRVLNIINFSGIYPLPSISFTSAIGSLWILCMVFLTIIIYSLIVLSSSDFSPEKNPSQSHQITIKKQNFKSNLFFTIQF